MIGLDIIVTFIIAVAENLTPPVICVMDNDENCVPAICSAPVFEIEYSPVVPAPLDTIANPLEM